jgi:ferredoxin-NADP reductase
VANPVKIKATITEVIRHADGVVSYAFEPQGRVPKFRAGQFLHLALDEYQSHMQWPESRVFSIASAPSERRSKLAITISTKGPFTERIYNTLEEGGECWLKLPYGDFLFPQDKHLALVAGGVGITPYLSLLKMLLEEKSEQHITLYYGVRSAEYYLFGDLLDACRKELPNFNLVVYSETELEGAERGYLSIEAIHAAVAPGTLFYLSGPPMMINNFRSYLLDQLVSPDAVVVDDWE